MRICVAQTRPVKGDIPANINQHKRIIELAVSREADLIVFPELSLTGYEPELAKALAIYQDDPRLDEFQNLADTGQITIGLGLPTLNNAGICISMIIFQPGQPKLTYSKRYLHLDEEAYFVSCQSFTGLLGPKKNIALAICYELSVPEHSEKAFKDGAAIYIASVAKTARGVKKAEANLAAIAQKYGMTVLMSNCVGPCDGEEGGGKSSIWNKQGVLLGQLNDSAEGIAMIDTYSQGMLVLEL